MLSPKALLDSFAEQSARLFGGQSLLPRSELENQFKSMLTSLFDKLDLVSRETFDQQMTVLAHTRARLEALEARVAELEKAAAEAKPTRKTHKGTAE